MDQNSISRVQVTPLMMVVACTQKSKLAIKTSDSFIYDPGNPVQITWITIPNYDFWAHMIVLNQRRPHVLYFTTDVLTEGHGNYRPQILATIWASSDAQRYGFHSYIN
ncbi:MAG: hypothetical protein Ct9H300mP19_18300 [Dehalococcoidia bacterium]|nr:MAG: hypothetical protein Ct9H300mP19_18300 [Dehalococcoidia bacterium]